MEDHDAIDYSDDLLEGVSIWRTPYSTSQGMLQTDLPENLVSYSAGLSPRHYPVILPDSPPTWPALSTPPHSPATLGFVVGCINPNPSSAPYQTLVPWSTNVTLPSAPPLTASSSAGALSGSFTGIPPLSGPLSSTGNIPLPPATSVPPPQGFGPDLVTNPPTRSGHKLKYRCFKSRVEDTFLRLEEDIQWGEVMDFADRVLVGRIRGTNYSAARLKTWATDVWGQHLVDVPFVQTFVRGWFAFRFARADHTNWVLSSFWHFEHAPVLLKRWTPLFDPATEQIGIGPVWIRLPDLPLQYWSEDIFRRIGNAIGGFMDYDKSYLHTGMMAYARLLINLDTRGGLQEYVTIQWMDSSRRQIIDYEGITYRCRRCHKVGHLYRDCPLLRKGMVQDQEDTLARPSPSPAHPLSGEPEDTQGQVDGSPPDHPSSSTGVRTHTSSASAPPVTAPMGDDMPGMSIPSSSFILTPLIDHQVSASA